MPAPYSTDLRLKAIAAYRAGVGTQQEVAAIFNIGEASLRRWLAAERRGELEPKVLPRRPHLRSINPAVLDQLKALHAEANDLSGQEYADLLWERHGVSTSKSSVNRALKQLGLTRKKRPSSQPRRGASG